MRQILCDVTVRIKCYPLFLFWFFSLPGNAFAQARGISPESGTTYFSDPPPDAAFLQLKEEMLMHRRNQNQTEEAICLQKMGQILYHFSSYSQAVEHLLQADKIFRAGKNPDLLAANLNILGTVYYYNQQSPKAWVQFREALAIYSKKNNTAGIAETYGLIGHMYEKQLLYDSAYFFQKEALGYARSAGDTAILASIHENIGSIYEDKALYDSARFYFLLSLNEYERLGNVVDQIEVINNLGDVWSKTGHFPEGMKYARKAATMADATGEKYQLQSAFRDIAQNFAGMQQFDSAYHYLEMSRHLIQSIYSTESSFQISLMQTLYDTEKKNTEIAQLNAAKKADTVMNVAIITVLLLLGILASLVISRQKMKIRNERAVNNSNVKVFETQKGLMESELKRQQLEETSLKQQLDIQSQELSSHILHLIQKNEVMEELKKGLTEIIKDDKRDQKKQVRQLLQKINISFSQDSYWEAFRLIFDKVHPSFMSNMQQLCPELTPAELRLLALVKMNLASGEMATLLGITPDSLRVIRYRAKKKLNLAQTESLTGFVQSI